MEPRIPTIIDHFAGLLAREHVVKQLEQLQPAFERPLQPGVELLALMGFALLRLKVLPPSPGYEPLFIENGLNPIIARGLAHLSVRSGRRQAEESGRRRPVFNAIRFLQVPRRKGAILSRVNTLLAAWKETSIIESIFHEAGLSETEFIKLLEAIDRGESIDYQRLTELAAEVASHLSLARGPKISAPSASHAFLLEHEIKLTKKRLPYSRNDRTAESCDALTEATRREFRNSDFDSRPARRRSKARKSSAS
jgi:hypothetical protein